MGQVVIEVLDPAVGGPDDDRWRRGFARAGRLRGVHLSSPTLDHLVAEARGTHAVLQDGGRDGTEAILRRSQARQPGTGGEAVLAHLHGLAPAVAFDVVRLEGDPAVTRRWWHSLGGTRPRGGAGRQRRDRTTGCVRSIAGLTGGPIYSTGPLKFDELKAWARRVHAFFNDGAGIPGRGE